MVNKTRDLLLSSCLSEPQSPFCDVPCAVVPAHPDLHPKATAGKHSALRSLWRELWSDYIPVIYDRSDAWHLYAILSGKEPSEEAGRIIWEFPSSVLTPSPTPFVENGDQRFPRKSPFSTPKTSAWKLSVLRDSWMTVNRGLWKLELETTEKEDKCKFRHPRLCVSFTLPIILS